ncbi:MAG: GT4 family glycosyltransferase PelF [Chloroflexota bacterium]|nr:GT4 family glycosyltransferase PelF [Chloroflexota bacterium]
MNEHLSVLLETEGTYPFVGGGVSTWCDILVRELNGPADAPDKKVNYHVCAITGDPNVKLRYQLMDNVKQLIHVPLWGTEEPAEFILPDLPFSEIYQHKQSTTPEVIEGKFIPLLRRFLRGLEETGLDMTSYGRTVHELYRYFQEYDYIESFKSPLVWELFQEEMLRPYRERPDDFLPQEQPNLYDLTTALRWLNKLLMVLNAPIPETDVTHATIAAFVGLVSVIAKLEYGTPMLLTEHGVYIRERYIHVSATDLTYFLKRFLINLSSLMSRLCYTYADQVSPVCNFNQKWERLYGVSGQKLLTIYNGVNPEIFVPAPKPEKSQGRPTVVAAARVFPLKDILTMIRTAAVVRQTIPDARFTVYGSLTADPPYVEKCRALIAELELEESFELGGFHSEPAKIFIEGDISILTSISEGFPYTVLESMSCGRPVVATDVGGVREALEGFGVVCRPGDPDDLAAGVIKLLQNDEARQLLGRKARNEVLAKYRTSRSVDAYWEAYQRLAEEKGQGRVQKMEKLDSEVIGPLSQ